MAETTPADLIIQAPMHYYGVAALGFTMLAGVLAMLWMLGKKVVVPATENLMKFSASNAEAQASQERTAEGLKQTAAQLERLVADCREWERERRQDMKGN